VLTTADVLDLCGLPPAATLTEWLRKGVVVPADAGGKGRGRTRRFTLAQAVGLAVATQVYRSARGCHLSYVGLVTEAFTAKDEAWLAGQFRRGRTHFLGVLPWDAGAARGVRLDLSAPRHPDQPDVRAAYDRAAAKVAGRPAGEARRAARRRRG
jgi:hypothetical protein